MGAPEVGRQLRALRTASGRTVASVAADAGLSVPYIANLENGRGNPTVAALGQLAAAHGMRLAISLVPAADAADSDAAGPGAGGVPASLVRLGRTDRFRRTAQHMAGPLGADEAEVSAQLVSVLAAVAATLRRDLSEADWWRLLDALLLVAASPAAG
ncbi:MAG TPA: helix-turn-helix transcriptional regulator [Streptosporangiaceae bacterium]|nr:helix-turn-helix transcriptional regulator [Streptosporangiaceae bacterium]